MDVIQLNPQVVIRLPFYYVLFAGALTSRRAEQLEDVAKKQFFVLIAYLLYSRIHRLQDLPPSNGSTRGVGRRYIGDENFPAALFFQDMHRALEVPQKTAHVKIECSPFFETNA